MKIHHVLIERFRGIKHLDWKLGGSMVCLLGPGDSGKTTILDAIEAALSPRWTLSLTDDDFHGGDTSQPISISVTVGELPDALLSAEKFGLELRGWTTTGDLRDEPVDDDEQVLTVRLSIDSSLEPEWVVKNDRNGDGRPISGRDREQFGVARIGSDPERHLRWGKGSALNRLTTGMGDVNSVLAAAARQARGSLTSGQLPSLEEAARAATEAIRGFGVSVRSPHLHPALGIETFTSTSAAVMLHDGVVPVHASGMGSRRLSAMALQSRAVRSGAILLVDELEHGLEPHRVRNLVTRLREAAGRPEGFGQVIATTHSAVVLVELPVNALRVVRSHAGTVAVLQPPAELQGHVRTNPDALLARRVLVTEGKTEVGVLRALDRLWEREHGAPLAHQGVAVVNGDGRTKCLGVALAFISLGYPVCLLADDDEPLEPETGVKDFVNAGGLLVVWGDQLAIEERIARDVPLAFIQKLLDFGRDRFGSAQVMGELKSRLGTHAASVTGHDVAECIRDGVPEHELRRAIGSLAKKSFGGWFKRTDYGEWLGSALSESLTNSSPLAQRLSDVEQWCYPS